MISSEELYQMYCDKGMTQKEIAEVYGVTQPMISYLMVSYKIKSRMILKSETSNSTKPSKTELVKMYHDEKMTHKEIGEVLNVGQRIVKKWMRLYDIESRTLSEARLINSVKPSKKVLEEMYHNKSMTMNGIAHKFDVCCTTIFKWFKSYEIKSRTKFDFAGENSPCWQGGISFEPYCERFNNKFKEAVRERDDYTCQLCGFEQNGQRLDVHHIHYDKANCYPDVVALCRSCNAKVNSNRDYWEKYFENHLLERGLMYWSLSQET